MSDAKISDIATTTIAVTDDHLFESEDGSPGNSEKTPASVLRDYMLLGPGMPFSESFALSDLTTAIVAGANKAYWRIPFDAQDLEFRASLLVASSAAGPFTIDVNKNGGTILSTKLTIDDTETTSQTAATPPAYTSQTAVEDDVFTFDVDDEGTGAKGCIVTVTGRRA